MKHVVSHTLFFVVGVLNIAVLVSGARADERMFAYSYEADVLPKDQLEFEQWLTLRSGHEREDYTAWDFREELEYGLLEKLTTSLYLNFTNTYLSPHEDADPDVEEESKTEFEGVSSEWKYQLLNPNLDLVGLVAYFEARYSGEETELEEKIILSKGWEALTLALNIAYEQEWARDHGDTVEEGALEFTTGASYKITPSWAVGLELKNDRNYLDGVDLTDEEFSAWFLGPNIHYGAPRWWATLAVLPQIFGNGDGASGDRQLEHAERLEIRLLVGVLF